MIPDPAKPTHAVCFAERSRHVTLYLSVPEFAFSAAEARRMALQRLEDNAEGESWDGCQSVTAAFCALVPEDVDTDFEFEFHGDAGHWAVNVTKVG